MKKNIIIKELSGGYQFEIFYPESLDDNIKNMIYVYNRAIPDSVPENSIVLLVDGFDISKK